MDGASDAALLITSGGTSDRAAQITPLAARRCADGALLVEVTDAIVNYSRRLEGLRAANPSREFLLRHAEHLARLIELMISSADEGLRPHLHEDAPSLVFAQWMKTGPGVRGGGDLAAIAATPASAEICAAVAAHFPDAPRMLGIRANASSGRFPLRSRDGPPGAFERFSEDAQPDFDFPPYRRIRRTV